MRVITHELVNNNVTKYGLIKCTVIYVVTVDCPFLLPAVFRVSGKMLCPF